MNLAAQLKRAYPASEGGEEPPLAEAAFARADALSELFREVAPRRREGEKIVVAVDALDEAGTRAGENVLGPPRLLPAGMFVLATRRPVDVALTVEQPNQVACIDPDSESNQGDVRAYLFAIAATAPVRRLLDAHDVAQEDFVETLADKSGHVWIYLRYAIDHLVRDGDAELPELPDGLWAWYHHFWRRWNAS
jgi:hypothetical protein